MYNKLYEKERVYLLPLVGNYCYFIVMADRTRATQNKR